MSEEKKNLNLAQRLNEVRKLVTYMQTVRGDQGMVVMQAAVIKKVRPALVEFGVLFMPVKAELLHHDFMKIPRNGKDDRLIFWCQVKHTFRFINEDDPKDFIEVEAIADGMDHGDKGSGKAFTYAVKTALLHSLNIERGDDPDMDPILIDADITPERATRIETIKRLAESICPEDPESIVNEGLEKIGQRYSRKITSLTGVQMNVMDQWISALQEQAGVEPETNGHTATQSNGTSSNGKPSKKDELVKLAGGDSDLFWDIAGQHGIDNADELEDPAVFNRVKSAIETEMQPA